MRSPNATSLLYGLLERSVLPIVRKTKFIQLCDELQLLVEAFSFGRVVILETFAKPVDLVQHIVGKIVVSVQIKTVLSHQEFEELVGLLQWHRVLPELAKRRFHCMQLLTFQNTCLVHAEVRHR